MVYFNAIIARTIHHYDLVEELPVIGPHRLRDDPREGQKEIHGEGCFAGPKTDFGERPTLSRRLYNLKMDLNNVDAREMQVFV